MQKLYHDHLFVYPISLKEHESTVEQWLSKKNIMVCCMTLMTC
jgi:hypothetical protein